MTSFDSPRRIAAVLVADSLAVAAAVGCGGQASDSSTANGFVLGAYDNCYLITFLDVSGGGGQSNLTGGVTLSQSGSNLTVNYGGDGGVVAPSSFEFALASATSATLLPGQQASGISVPCAPSDFTPSAAKLTSGSLTSNAGTLFLSVEGTDEPVDAGNGCSNPGGKAAVVMTCGANAKPQTAPSAGSSEASLGNDFVGVYTCQSQALNRRPPATVDAGDGYYSGDSNTLGTKPGALTITEAGGVLTASYANDPFVVGSMQFVPTTRSAAVPATATETMQVECSDPFTDVGDPPLSALPVTSSTLTIDGSSVVLSFFGNMTPSSTCPGAETFVSLLCTK